MEQKNLSLSQVTQMVGGFIRRGEKNYVIDGLTAIGSAKDNEICIASNCHDVHRLTQDVKVVLVPFCLEGYLVRTKVPNIVIVDDIEKASTILMKSFSELNS